MQKDAEDPKYGNNKKFTFLHKERISYFVYKRVEEESRLMRLQRKPIRVAA